MFHKKSLINPPLHGHKIEIFYPIWRNEREKSHHQVWHDSKTVLSLSRQRCAWYIAGVHIEPSPIAQQEARTLIRVCKLAQT